MAYVTIADMELHILELKIYAGQKHNQITKRC
jgi:hypothetical protein